MSDDLSIQGTLAETTVPDLFRSLIRSSETGMLLLEATGRNDVIYFQEGRLIFATSSDPDMSLGEILLRGGEINLQQYSTAMDRVLMARQVGAVLVELGYLKSDELMRAAERQVSAIVLNAVSLRSGNYTIEFTTEFPEGIIALPISTERLILDGVHRIDYWSLIFRGISRLDRMLTHVPGADRRTYNLELTDEESHVMSLLADAQTVEQLCARSYLSNFITCRTIWGLLAVNFIQDAVNEAVSERRAAEETEYELEEMVERYNGVFQSIFALVFQKIGDHIYDFMDRVILHLAPDRLPYLSGMSLVNEGRIDFDQLFNNLVASGSASHSTVVQELLNELITGWVFESKSEFRGTPLETQVVKLAASVRK